ncbi:MULTISPECIES: transposase [Aerosakkonema]|uniref:transposase n=1 Tax=Aerosakkonema TaxID=1246629 RepID=UPI0035BA0FDA
MTVKLKHASEWLKNHPGVKVVSRDRSKVYKNGIMQGAPEAMQVADRFHLLQNLAEVLEQVFRKQEKAIKAVEASHRVAESEYFHRGKSSTHFAAVLNPTNTAANGTKAH